MDNRMEMVCVSAVAGAREAYMHRRELPEMARLEAKLLGRRIRGAAERWFDKWKGHMMAALLGSIATLVFMRAVSPVAMPETAAVPETTEVIRVEEMQRDAEAVTAAARRAGEEGLREREAEAMARVLYGTAQRCGEEARRAICWCIINRCESPIFPDSIEGVCAQEAQWMGYSAENPVIEELYDTARGVVDAWHDGGRRMIGTDFLYMSWEGTTISLRTSFEEGASTRYWHG